jgi:hypothetical protein
MYAFVDVTDYQKVTVSDASKGIEAAAKDYLKQDFELDLEEIEKEITISKITNVSIDGNTYFYITDTDNKKYKVSIKISDNLAFIKVNDKLKICYIEEKDITDITRIK